MVIIGAIAPLLLVAGLAPVPQVSQQEPAKQTPPVVATPNSPAQDPTATVRRLVSIMQLASQEYRLGVVDGKIVAAPEVEEARLFLEEARRSAATLPAEAKDSAIAQLDAMIAIVGHTASPDSLAASSRRLAVALATQFGVALEEAPSTPPSLARGADVYRANCASCHGDRGDGKGPLAAALDPKPADFTDTALMADQKLVDLYRRITIGVVGTSMPSFEAKLPEDDRWAAALYVTTFHRPSAGPVFTQVRAQLDTAYALARQGDASAGPRSLDAYMTFEQVERPLRAKHPELAAELEAAFAKFRQQLSAQPDLTRLGNAHQELVAGLNRAEQALTERMSPANLFTQSFVIMLREGLEAILVIGALLTFLVKMGASHRRRDVHWGIAAAVAASLATAVALETVFHLTPAKQEVLEGFTMVAATVVLFYVSYWLLSKMEVAKWNHFVKSKVHDALTSGSSLALASAAFLAVYREGFETVLFYKALFVAAGDNVSTSAVVGGMVAGGVVMTGVYIAINRFGIRLPLKPFFAVTSAFLYYMAFVFAGKGIAELQAGSFLPMTPVKWAPTLPALGIYPTMETLVAQGILLILLAAALLWTFIVAPYFHTTETKAA